MHSHTYKQTHNLYVQQKHTGTCVGKWYAVAWCHPGLFPVCGTTHCKARLCMSKALYEGRSLLARSRTAPSAISISSWRSIPAREGWLRSAAKRESIKSGSGRLLERWICLTVKGCSDRLCGWAAVIWPQSFQEMALLVVLSLTLHGVPCVCLVSRDAGSLESAQWPCL